MSFKSVLVAAVAAAGFAAAPALAQDVDASDPSAGDFLVRLRAIAVVPNDDDDLNAPLDTSITTEFVPEIDFTYFVTDNIALELIAAIAPHEISARGGGAILDVGEVWVLPPTLTAQYHVTQLDDWTGVEALGRFKPYVGAGVNYTIFFTEDNGQFDDVDLDNSFGPAIQFGVDVAVTDRFFLNADVKRIWMDTDVDINNGAVSGEVDINPWIFGIGAGYRF